jgi:hypothetical protein
MYAHQGDSGETGVVARDFIAKTPPTAYKGLPERASSGKMPDFRASVLNKIMSQLNQE